MTNSGSDKPSRIRFDEVDVYQIQRILSTGTFDSLTPAERAYYDLMELVRGLRARVTLHGGTKIVTKAGIIRLLKSEPYGLTDWMARQVYADAINFFYTDDTVTPRAWASFYADRCDKLMDAAIATGNLREARAMLVEAAKLRGCYDAAPPEIPDELLNARQTVIYATDAESIGAPKADRRQIEAFIDSMPAEVSEITRDRVKQDAGVKKKNLLKRLAEDVKEFTEDQQ